ncbi:hypothetical protein CR5_194 [Cronobacter phage CR5]|uniref:hypothetical protein n=1 Tax=Cronobacter phage CR5 TaxID=1195085 RepID=UPI0003427054|nr:hypothetical protein CR5_194 [Cronobacter phage CR5]EBZ2963222.1 hypothetical protein [Salmonella enterica subsp. enterica serovar Enteritidis]ECG1798536.1 hypothetical protein [Salmonella enterica subsp. enterica serovar Paratyphi B]ECG3269000.1 hypothetical protein [Salmonella enterica subsp. enterica serovar Infantis]EIP7032341.1 hypothetical protein [Salmonella enterica]AFO71414.1 hypothetical protein CR5_194 [Cronobacter phage CR5]
MIFTRRCLVDVSCFLDDRIALVAVRHPELMEKLDYDAYRLRITEVWAKIIGIDNFLAEYKTRDVSVLKAALPTQFIKAFRERLEEDLLAIKLSAPIERPTLTVNLYPYSHLSVPERNAFREVFSELFPMVQVNVVCISLDDLTPEYLRSNWDSWFTYDFYPWLEINAKRLSTRIPRFVIHRPGILTDELTPETIEAIKRDKADPFAESKKFLAEYVAVETLKAELFCHVPGLDIMPKRQI